MPRHVVVAGFLIPISCLIIASAIPTAGAIDCFKCVSMNGTNAACDDPFHNNHSVDILESPCMGGRKGRDGLFPATSCIKIAGVYDDTGERITVRGCALDSGTLTTDTEIIRMSHCGRFYYDDRYVHGCLQSCSDADACNSGHSLVPAHRQQSAWWRFFTTTNAATLASLLYTLLSGAGDVTCSGASRRERRKTVTGEGKKNGNGASNGKEKCGSRSEERIKNRKERDRNSVICIGDTDTTHRSRASDKCGDDKIESSRSGTSFDTSQSKDVANKYRARKNINRREVREDICNDGSFNNDLLMKTMLRACRGSLTRKNASTERNSAESRPCNVENGISADGSHTRSGNFTLESREAELERNCLALGSDTNYNQNCDACGGRAGREQDRRPGGGLAVALKS